MLVTTLAVTACQSSSDKRSALAQSSAKVTFPHKVQADYAEGFRISYHENYKLLEILRPFQDQTDTLRYSLVPRELAGKVEVAGALEIPIPVHKLIATSTTHIGLLGMLNAYDVLSGFAGAKYVYSEKINERIKSGDIIGLPQGVLNKEKILAMNPDMLMISGGESSQFDNYRVLIDSGINVFVNSEWLETTPLGKAEWVKVMAALLNKEELANEEFSRVAAKYRSLKAAADTVTNKPLVINGMPYKGAWFVSGGNSFAAQFLKDAGADYPWFDTVMTGGLRKSFEVVYRQGLEADVWINPGAAASKGDIIAKDSRLKEFKSFKTGKIYNKNKRKRPSGGNDYWESGVVHPEILLADLIKVLHPGLVPDHELYYYQEIN